MSQKINYEGFSEDIDKLRADTFARLSIEDFQHMRRFEIIGRISTVIGLLTAWFSINIISIFFLGVGSMTRWLMMHHIGHGGYDKVPGIPKRYTSKYFAIGARRFIDWFDWIHPVAWNYEHNFLHHYHTSEHTDPDLVERNLQIIRDSKAPKFLKYIMLFFGAISWKYTYYAANTLNGLEAKRRGHKQQPHTNFINVNNFWDLRIPLIREFWTKCFLPYFTVHFVVIPLAFSPLGKTAVFYVLLNKFFAEVFINIHSFMIIAPNHTGDDLVLFNSHFANKDEFYVNQVLSSVNYWTGSDLIDYPQMWLNYQIEHHLIPDLPMLKYQEIQPVVKEICLKHNVPYVQQSVYRRCKKLIDVCVGNTTMKKVSAHKPVELEINSSLSSY